MVATAILYLHQLYGVVAARANVRSAQDLRLEERLVASSPAALLEEDMSEVRQAFPDTLAVAAAQAAIGAQAAQAVATIHLLTFLPLQGFTVVKVVAVLIAARLVTTDKVAAELDFMERVVILLI
jgi:hypothetical protein